MLKIYVVFFVLRATNTYRAGAEKLVLQDDGNLVVYSGSIPIWHTDKNLAFDLELRSGIKVWDDRGSGADMDLSVFRSNLSSGEYSLGDVAVLGHQSTVSTLIVKPRNNFARALVAPIYFQKIWDDSGSGADSDISNPPK